MAKQSLKRVPKIALVLFLAALFIPSALNLAGFCIAEKRFLSAEEKFLIALEYTNRPQDFYIPSPNAMAPKKTKQVPYKNAQEILAKHPNCCEIFYTSTPIHSESVGTWYLPEASLVATISGHRGNWIKVAYPAQYHDENGTLKTYKDFHRYVHINNCGKAPNSDVH